MRQQNEKLQQDVEKNYAMGLFFIQGKYDELDQRFKAWFQKIMIFQLEW
jgi:hypothetical protein